MGTGIILIVHSDIMCSLSSFKGHCKEHKVEELAFAGDDALEALKKSYNAKNKSALDKKEEDALEYMLCQVLPVVTRDEWLPSSGKGRNNYCGVVSTSDEIMALWLMKYHNKKPWDKVEIAKHKAEHGKRKTRERLAGDDLEDSKKWLVSEGAALLQLRKGLSEEQLRTVSKNIGMLAMRKINFGKENKAAETKQKKKEEEKVSEEDDKVEVAFVGEFSYIDLTATADV